MMAVLQDQMARYAEMANTLTAKARADYLALQAAVASGNVSIAEAALLRLAGDSSVATAAATSASSSASAAGASGASSANNVAGVSAALTSAGQAASLAPPAPPGQQLNAVA
jgi:hypothetical protein